jgi:hypothetical protein
LKGTDVTDDLPTIDSPASGQAVSVVNDRKFVLSAVDYWYDGSQFVVRSREFDCLAEGNDLDEALRAFRASVLNYAETLQEREESGGATEREIEARKLLSDRLSRIFLEERRRPRRGFLRRHRPSDDIGLPKVLA